MLTVKTSQFPHQFRFRDGEHCALSYAMSTLPVEGRIESNVIVSSATMEARTTHFEVGYVKL